MTLHTSETDMIAKARTVQWTADEFADGHSLKLAAPAKVNLFLGVGQKRSDGFHEVVNVMHALALHDTLYAKRIPALDGFGGADFSPLQTAIGGPSNNLAITISTIERGGLDSKEIPAEKNLVFKAFDRLARRIDYRVPEEIVVHIEKVIPYEGGLGGGSSDAAAALAAAARFWNLSPHDDAVRETAQKLGSDVAFFLYGKCALFEGVGERFVHALEPMAKNVVIMKPHGGVSTAAAYDTFDENPVVIEPSIYGEVLGAQTAEEVPLYNNLAPASESLMPELADVRQWCERQSEAESVLLCGSGACTFAITRSFGDAAALAAAAQKRGLWARATMFSSLYATVIPG